MFVAARNYGIVGHACCVAAGNYGIVGHVLCSCA